ncbi:uncharacterized protein LOC144926305 [Branchiostoma floridae x Branchiostoma belcheri]
MKPPKRERKAVQEPVYKGPVAYRRSTLSTKWSLKDKKKLLTALKRVRSHDDYTIIKKYVKNKTEEEIKEYVTMMKKKSETLVGKSLKSDKEAERTPIETWLETCRDLMREVPVECTQTFSQVLTVAAAEPANLEEPDDAPDYPAIYNYLSCLLRNATPPTLAPLDSAVVLDLLQSLADRLKTTDVSQLKEWLQMRFHDLNKSYVPDRPWQNPFKLTPEDLSLCDPQSSSQKKADDSSEQTSDKQQTTSSTSPGHNTEAATTAEVLDSKSASKDTKTEPSTSTIEPSTSSASNKTLGDGKKETSDERGIKEVEEILCLNPLLIPTRYLELEKLDFDSEGSDSEEED